MSGRRGWSVGALLIGAGLVGTLVGTIAGRRLEEDPEVSVQEVEREAARTAPLGTPNSARATPEHDPMVPTVELLDGFPPFPGAKPRAMGSTSAVMGMPLELAWFTTKTSAAEVLRFYEHAFDTAGLFWISQRQGPDVGSVGYLERDGDPDAGVAAGVLRLVSVVGRAGGGESMVFLSRSQPQRALEGPRASLPEGVLLPEGAQAPAVVEVNDEGSRQATVSARVPDAQVAGVASSLQARQRAEGWDLVDVAGDERRTTWSARRAGGLTTTALRQVGASVDVLVTRHGGSPAR